MKLETLKATFPCSSIRPDKFVGDRPVSRTDKLILFKFLERVFAHNHLSPPESRLEDHQIKELTLQEFAHVSNVVAQLQKRNYIAIWRSQFNHGKMNTSIHDAPGFVAYRVMTTKRFTKSTSNRFVLSVVELVADYNTRNLIVPASLLAEVKAYF